MNKVTLELIEEAKRRYPIGTVYVPAHINKGLMKVTSHSEGLRNNPGSNCIVFQSEQLEGNWLECVWDEFLGWAEIKHLGKDPEVKNEYQIY